VRRIRKTLRRAEMKESKKIEWEMASLEEVERLAAEAAASASVSLPDQSIPGNPLPELPLDAWTGVDPLLDFSSYGLEFGDVVGDIAELVPQS